VQTKIETREAHPLEAKALDTVAKGFVEFACKGGPESVFVMIEIPISEALERGVQIHGPDMRSILADKVAARVKRGEL
jgi:hypothetical protein